MPRRTKIVATLGPATDTPEVMEAVIRAGVDVVRLNFSHGEPDEHKRRVELLRKASAAAGKDISSRAGKSPSRTASASHSMPHFLTTQATPPR